ncbi:efflux RND transporter periplasmic adaptor subunit [Gluconobacter roseus]|uniref:efflux RND transporter periplasmic adaptor subunit n=1 Tax=Gluconobacter roseus TaxID=586239 RepID=UPI000AF00CE1|nr:efflux RND transporter periplasmic adaptor subunit [Gluconobacter roseus]
MTGRTCRLPLMMSSGFLLVLAACHKHTPPPDTRPVRSIVIQPVTSTTGEPLTGQVAPHRSVALSFRLPGKIVERSVSVGSTVHAGQVVARLDEVSARQTLQAATADVEAAKADLVQMETLRHRATALLPVKAISKNDYDDVTRRYHSAQSAVQSTEARMGIAQESVDHTRLTADADGIVTDRLAEVGEVVAAGQPVLRVAESGERDVQFDIPASLLRSRNLTGETLSVCLDADMTVCTQAQLYEIAPDADPLTRTYRAKALLHAPPRDMTLGSVVITRMVQPDRQEIRLPPAALTAQDGKTAVWIVAPGSSTVSLRQIEIARYTATDVLVASGLKAGDRVVTAGVQALYPNQKVTLLNDADVRP